MLTFYPPAVLVAVFAANGWSVERRKTLLNPVPWTEAHLDAHAEVVREYAAALPDIANSNNRRRECDANRSGSERTESDETVSEFRRADSRAGR